MVLHCRETGLELLLYQVDIILKKLDTQKQIKTDVRFLFPRVVLPTVRCHLQKFDIGIDEEELVT